MHTVIHQNEEFLFLDIVAPMHVQQRYVHIKYENEFNSYRRKMCDALINTSVVNLTKYKNSRSN